MKLFDRALRSVGLRRISASNGQGFKGATQNRLTADWAVAIASADQKIRGSLKAMRARSRQLAGDNDYAARFLNKLKENVIGPNGIGLQMVLDKDAIPAAEKLNRAIESGWSRYCEKATTDGQMSLVDAAQLWAVSLAQDGECFTRRVKGYPHTACRFAIDIIDPDQVDVSFGRMRQQFQNGTVQNEIRMGVELDEWRRPVSYWVFNGHPAELPGVSRTPVSSAEMTHSYIFKLLKQTRGIPFFHTAMTRMNMLGGYEEAELVAARLAACKMAAIESKTGDDMAGQFNKTSGAVELDVEPASLLQLPEGMHVNPIDWQHPGGNFPEFTKAMLRGVAVGLNSSYSTLTGDLREVNFSSIRQGILDEREGWKLLQTFAIGHFYRPIFADWLVMALTTGQLQLPTSLPVQAVIDAATWQARGWDWVDPRTDVDADIKAIRASLGSLQDSCAKRGKDWRDVIDQRAREIEYARLKGVPIDLTTAGSGGVEGDSADEAVPGGGSKPKPNGKGALMHSGYVRLEQ